MKRTSRMPARNDQEDRSNNGNNGNNKDNGNDSKERDNEKSDKYYGNGKGPKDWDQFYEEDPDPFNERPDYSKDPIQKSEYKYDSVGNRIGQNEDGKITKYRYNELNELVQAGDKFYYHDANGNLVEKETKEGTIKYDYTTDNRLKGVYYPDSSLVEYKYDALRRKASRH